MSLEKPFTEDILDSIGEGLFTVDKNFKINFINRAAEKIIGYQRGEVVGKFCKHVFKSTLCAGYCPIARVLETGKNLYDENAELIHKNGQKVRVKLNAAVLRNQGREPEGGVVSFRKMSTMEEIHQYLNSADTFYGMVGHSKAMKEIFQLIEEIADSDASVLIQGESGTGKELIADAIQKTSLRKERPYVKVNCSVFPPQLLASELFGHVRGAFTGAIRDRIGRFEMANQGTLFLDEVAEMPLQMQLQLLRVLQEGTYERIGESVTRKVDVRIIAATNKNIEEAIRKGEFREDLYYRLNVIPIFVPPLRDRSDDIPYLIKFFLKKYSLIHHKEIREVDSNAMDILISYEWPGNVRELENAIEYSFVRSKSRIIGIEVLPPHLREKCLQYRRELSANLPAKKMSEYQQLLEVLEKHHWNRTRVARELGIGRTTLWRKMKMLGLLK